MFLDETQQTAAVHREQVIEGIGGRRSHVETGTAGRMTQKIGPFAQSGAAHGENGGGSIRRCWAKNRCASAITEKRAGVEIIPIEAL